MRALLAVALGALCATAPAAAQVAPGSFDTRGNVVTRFAMTEQIARCVVGTARDSASAVVVARRGTSEFDKVAGRMGGPIQNCMRTESATVGVVDLRGSLAELLLKREGGRLLARVAALPVVAPVRIIASENDENADEALFDCVVAAQPVEAAAMLGSAPETAQEGQAFRKLVPSLQGCVPVDTEFHLKPHQVRLLVAISLYRRIATAQAPAVRDASVQGAAA